MLKLAGGHESRFGFIYPASQCEVYTICPRGHRSEIEEDKFNRIHNSGFRSESMRNPRVMKNVIIHAITGRVFCVINRIRRLPSFWFALRRLPQSVARFPKKLLGEGQGHNQDFRPWSSSRQQIELLRVESASSGKRTAEMVSLAAISS